MDNNYLQHYGVPGMRWGFRRYQNKNGTLTKAGKNRRKTNSDDYNESRKIKSKKIREMSNAELKKLNERQQLEKNYRNLNSNVISKGMKFITTATSITGASIALYKNSDVIVKAGRSVVDKIATKNSIKWVL